MATGSQADLLILASNVALESMGFKTFGFGGGRKTSGSRKKIYTGVPRKNGWRPATNPIAATVAIATSTIRSPSCRWD
ncbi:MAG: hypothetical protein IPJ06_05740 [Saprospiraceae bacterium]|nr:hypothetical protein [Saprospiraceae bacterium]